MIKFDGAGFRAEALAAKQFNGTLVTEKSQQYRDIDLTVMGKDKTIKTISVKDQLWSSGKYKAIQIETQLTNTRRMKTVNGCFYQNCSDYYLWRVETSEHGDTWLVIESDVIKAYVAAHKDTLKPWRTTAPTEAKNRSYGRTYDRAGGYVIPLSEVMKLAKTIVPVLGG